MQNHAIIKTYRLLRQSQLVEVHVEKPMFVKFIFVTILSLVAVQAQAQLCDQKIRWELVAAGDLEEINKINGIGRLNCARPLYQIRIEPAMVPIVVPIVVPGQEHRPAKCELEAWYPGALGEVAACSRRNRLQPTL